MKKTLKSIRKVKRNRNKVYWEGTHLLDLACARINPLLCLIERLVEGQKTGLTTTLDQLIGFSDELDAGLLQPLGQCLLWGKGMRILIEEKLGNPWVSGGRGWSDLKGRIDKLNTIEPVCEQKLGVVFTDGCRRD